MRSGTSYFNFTLFRKNTARFWPIWGLYALVWVLLLPVATLAQRESWTAALAREYPLNLLTNASSIVLVFLWAILCAMAVFSYLYSSRSAGLFHALPIRREGLFLTNYLSGLFFLVIPQVLAFLLGLLAAGLNGRVVFSSLFTWLVSVTLMSLFFYSFAVLCAMFTGHILALPALFFILSVLPVLLSSLLEYLAQELLFGFTGADWLDQGAIWLSPLLHIMRSTGLSYSEDGAARYYGLGLVALYALVGLVFAGAALTLYRRRRLETAGDVISVSWMRPLFQWGVAACSALATGLFFYSIFYTLLPQGTWTILGWMLLWGAVGWFVAAMLLQKKFWVFKGSWKGCVVLLACVVVLVGAVELDLPGYERAVPSEKQVVKVSMGSIDTYPYDSASSFAWNSSDPQIIGQTLALHPAVVDRREELQAWAHDDSYLGQRWSMTEGGYEVETFTSVTLRLVYSMADGSLMERQYRLPIRQEDLDTAGTPANLLQTLLNQPALVEQAYFEEEDRLVDACLVNLYDEEQEEYVYQPLPADLLEPLMEAVLADIKDGNLGRRYLLENQERMDNCCYTDLELTFRDTSGLPGATPVPTNNTLSTDDTTYTVTITLQKSASRVMEVLKDYPNAFLSQAQVLYQSQG